MELSIFRFAARRDEKKKSREEQRGRGRGERRWVKGPRGN